MRTEAEQEEVFHANELMDDIALLARTLVNLCGLFSRINSLKDHRYEAS
jgi:hypothetical protein